MKSYNDICSGIGQKFLNTGARSQCLEAVTVLLVLAKDSFRFDTLEDFRKKSVWDSAIESKALVPLFELYELAPANTEATFYESRNFKKQTQKAAKITTAELYLSICSDNALRSYAGNGEYSRVFEVTEEGDIIGVYDSDGIKIKGQKLKDFSVGIRQVATTDKPPTTEISIAYADYEELSGWGVLTTPDFDPVLDLSGIFGIAVTVVSATTSAISFRATEGCGNVNFGIATPTAWKVLENDGISEVTATFAYVSATETYTATGTFVSGKKYFITSGGVQTETVSGDFYEVWGEVSIP